MGPKDRWRDELAVVTQCYVHRVLSGKEVFSQARHEELLAAKIRSLADTWRREDRLPTADQLRDQLGFLAGEAVALLGVRRDWQPMGPAAVLDPPLSNVSGVPPDRRGDAGWG
jgi:hypothetical protein